MTKAEAAAYAGCRTLSAFSDQVRRGILPGPIPGTHTWDRRAIDLALDRASGLHPTVTTSGLAEWRAKRDARRA